MTRFNKGDVVRLSWNQDLGDVDYSVEDATSVHWRGDSYPQIVDPDNLILVTACAVDLHKGDRVRLRGRTMEGVVTDAGEFYSNVLWDGVGKEANARNTALILIKKAPKPKALSWNDVQVGDKVTFEFKGEAITATAHKWANNVGIIGHHTRGAFAAEQFTLISVEKPTPPLPTEPGTALEVEGIPGLVHRRMVRLESLDLTWISDSSALYTDDQIAARSWKVA